MLGGILLAIILIPIGKLLSNWIARHEHEPRPWPAFDDDPYAVALLTGEESVSRGAGERRGESQKGGAPATRKREIALHKGASR